MIEWVLIAALSWFGYSQHERAVDAEALFNHVIVM